MTDLTNGTKSHEHTGSFVGPGGEYLRLAPATWISLWGLVVVLLGALIGGVIRVEQKADRAEVKTIVETHAPQKEATIRLESRVQTIEAKVEGVDTRAKRIEEALQRLLARPPKERSDE